MTIKESNEKSQGLNMLYNLIETKRYNDIYKYYGKDAYLKLTPKKYMKKDIRKLFENKEFDVIKNKYGKFGKDEVYYIKLYDKNIGNKKIILNKVQLNVESYEATIVLSTATVLIVIYSFLNLYVPFIERKNYANELKEYNKNLTEYASELKQLELTDLQLFMKIMDDMWEEFEYGEPSKPYTSDMRVAVTAEKIGVCRHFSDHFQAVLNAVKPELKANIVFVHSEPYNGNMVDIYRPIVGESKELLEEVTNNNAELNESYQISETNVSDSNIESYALENEILIESTHDSDVNHAVVVICEKEDNAYIIVDPTNLSIGYLKDNEIHILNEYKDEIYLEESYKYKFLFTLTDVINYNNFFDNILSYNTNGNYDELNEKYGYEAQIKALEYVRGLDKTLRIEMK